ncbi:AraC family transcriptional regulator [Sandaracinobacter sp. RS1-74]|uniref:helix-turn-helix domain-containing protein n=1 Tax=Sandaracinobacteroides sayramensis TaxID=2913411 RepID=UPI001EDBF8B8|nr:AraC family transcriptional regulator [Sandaracinobacteroides sayramensis]MCG2841231.1 AraC family transcriptional regulator [Sandaracinobacteroides sayramensis]
MLDRIEVEPDAALRRPTNGVAVAQPAVASVEPPLARQRFKAGRLDFDYRIFAKQRSSTLTPTEAMVHVVVPLAGEAVVVGIDESYSLVAGQALLLAGAERTICVWMAGSRALLLHVPRAALQSEASRLFGEPRRVSMIDCVFDWTADAIAACRGDLTHHAIMGRPVDLGPKARTAAEKCVLAALIDALRADAQAGAIFPVARSVQRAVDYVRQNPCLNWTVEELAALAGVSAGTLHRNFRNCLGISPARLVQQLRLEWVRARVSCATESRSIGELAVASGFGLSGMLNRAYQRHFGETPTQTRARAFRSQRD